MSSDNNIDPGHEIFVRVLLTDKVKLKPKHVNKNIKTSIEFVLRSKYEAKCSHHGYILQNSITIQKYSAGRVMAVSLNGDVIFNVSYFAKVCNPAIGSIVNARIVNMNKFGILAESKVNNTHILEFVIPTNIQNASVNSVQIGDDIDVEILGKRFELNDKKISVIGKIVEKKTKGGKDNKGKVGSLMNDPEIPNMDFPDDDDEVDAPEDIDEADADADADADDATDVDADVDDDADDDADADDVSDDDVDEIGEKEKDDNDNDEFFDDDAGSGSGSGSISGDDVVSDGD
jgi:DNA-directed RNA polymerase subunit E'/Rpb7